MISSVILFVKGISEIVSQSNLAESGNMQIPDIGHIMRSRKKMAALKGKFACNHGANLGELKRLADSEVKSSDGLSMKERQRNAIIHWFNPEKAGKQDLLSERLQNFERNRKYSLPAIEPLPSVEDSFLAWSSEDEYLFEAPVRELWRDFADERTVVAVYVDADPEFDASPVVQETSGSNFASNAFWID